MKTVDCGVKICSSQEPLSKTKSSSQNVGFVLMQIAKTEAKMQ
jgi:hypothetical protein